MGSSVPRPCVVPPLDGPGVTHVRCAPPSLIPAAEVSFPTFALEPAKMWMNVKPFLASVREVTASTQSVLMSANALQDTSRVRPATDVKMWMSVEQSPACVMVVSVPTQQAATCAHVRVVS